MKNILFPTDFTAQSLRTLELYVKGVTGMRFNIILFAAFQMPDSDQDAVGSRPHLAVMNETFRKGCKKLKEKYTDKIGQIHYKFMYGTTKQVFRNYIDFNEIDLILFPDGYTIGKPHEKSIDPAALINGSSLSVIREMPVTAQIRTLPVHHNKTTAEVSV